MDRIKEHSNAELDHRDFLARMLKIKEGNPEKFNMMDVIINSMQNIAAGSDTTSITLRSILYHLMKNPRYYKKLQDEIDEMTVTRTSEDEEVKYSEAFKMPYLQAVIKEGLRIHPALAVIHPRIVPEEGAVISGKWLPSGVKLPYFKFLSMILRIYLDCCGNLRFSNASPNKYIWRRCRKL